MTEWVDGVRVAAALAALGYAAYTDRKTREVPNEVWYLLGAAAFVLFAVDLSLTFGGQAWVLAVPVALVFAVAVLGGEFVEVIPGDEPPPEGYELNAAERSRLRLDLALTAVCLGLAFAIFWFAGSFDLGPPAGLLQGPQVQAYTAVVMFGFTYVLFFLSLISGAADAKCLLVLAMLFPVPPAFAGLPLIHPPPLAALAVPFSLAAFFNGAILLVVLRIPASIAMSARKGTVRFPASLGGYPKPLSEVNLDREWIQGTVIEGAFKESLMPTHGAHSDERQRETLQHLKDKGVATVFVTPRLPFMVYLLAGFVVLVVLSSPLFFVGGWR